MGMPPSNDIFFSSVSVPKPIDRESGDQNARTAPSVLSSRRGNSLASGRTIKMETRDGKQVLTLDLDVADVVILR